MKKILDYVNENKEYMIPIFELSSKFMQRAAEKQREKLKDDDYLDSISAKKERQLQARAEKFAKYADELELEEMKTTKWQLDWNKKHHFNFEIITTADITSKDGFSGYFTEEWGLKLKFNTQLSNVTKLYISSQTYERYGGDHMYEIFFDCNGKYGGHMWITDFFDAVGKKKFTFKDYTTIKKVYDEVLDDMEDHDEEYRITHMKESDFMDLVNGFDDSSMGNKHGSLKLDSVQLYYLLLTHKCYIGTKAQKEKFIKNNGNGRWHPYWNELMSEMSGAYRLASVLNCDEDEIISYGEREDIDDIEEINITNVKDARSTKFFKNRFGRSAIMYLVDVMLHNNISRFIDSAHRYTVISKDQEFTYEYLEKWMKTFGLTKDKVHIDGKKVWIDINDFPDAG